LAAHPDAAETIRARYCMNFAPCIRRWAVLSSNARTLAIFLLALAGAPLLYFLLEIFGFTAVLAWLLAAQRRRYEDFASSFL